MRRFWPLAFVTLMGMSSGLLAGCTPPPLPTVSLPAYSFPLGATLQAKAGGPIPVRLTWHQLNAGKVRACGYQVARAYRGKPNVIIYKGTAPTMIDQTTGPDLERTYQVRALNCAKHPGPFAVDKRSVYTLALYPTDGAVVHFNGTWLVKHNPAYIGGEALQATEPGAGASFLQGARGIAIVSDTSGGKSHVSLEASPIGRMDIAPVTPVHYRRISYARALNGGIGTIHLTNDTTTLFNAFLLMFVRSPLMAHSP